MTEAIIEFFRSIISNDYLTTVIIAFIPIVELRGAIPVAIEMGMEWWQAFGLSYIGSCLAIPILLLLLRPILNMLKRLKFFNRFATTIEDMFISKAAKIAAKASGGGDASRREMWIKLIGVFTFVALPIPLTGVWTGTAIAVFLGLPFFKALAAVMLGNLTAGTIVTLLSVFFKPYLDTILMVFFVLVIVIVVFYIILISIKMIKSRKRDKLMAGQSGMQVRDIEINVSSDMSSNTSSDSNAPLCDDGVKENGGSNSSDKHSSAISDSNTPLGDDCTIGSPQQSTKENSTESKEK